VKKLKIKHFSFYLINRTFCYIWSCFNNYFVDTSFWCELHILVKLCYKLLRNMNLILIKWKNVCINGYFTKLLVQLKCQLENFGHIYMISINPNFKTKYHIFLLLLNHSLIHWSVFPFGEGKSIIQNIPTYNNNKSNEATMCQHISSTINKVC